MEKELIKELNEATTQIADNHWVWIFDAARSSFEKRLEETERDIATHMMLVNIEPLPQTSGIPKTRSEIVAELHRRREEYVRIVRVCRALRTMATHASAVAFAKMFRSSFGGGR